MRTKKLLATMLLLVFTTFSLVACGKTYTTDDFIGTWEATLASGKIQTYNFYEKGECTVETSAGMEVGTFTVEDETITIVTKSATGKTKTTSMKFKFNKDSIEFKKSGKTTTYNKK